MILDKFLHYALGGTSCDGMRGEVLGMVELWLKGRCD
jgi:hypothetical protein